MKFIFWLVIAIIGSLAFYRLETDRRPLAKSHVIDSAKAKRVSVIEDSNPLVRASLKEFESYIKMMLANRQAPGAALAVIKDTSIIFLKGFGLKQIGKKDSVDAQTVFRIGSVSKSVTATLCAILVKDGVIQWDDPVIKYLPDFKLKSEDATRKLTLRHLLSHTEGLPYHAYTDMVDRSAPVDTLIDYLQDLDLIAEPGQIYSYQNVGFSLIGKVIESATKKSFEEVLTEKLFKPLEMKEASASFQKISANKNVAMPHKLIQPLKLSDIYYSVAPAGGINASAQDMAFWLKEVLTQNKRTLPKEQLDSIFDPQVRATVRNLNFFKWKKIKRSSYGLGWRVIAFADGDTLLYHGGLVNNYRCEVAINKKEQIAIALLVNSPGMLADKGVPQFFTIYDRYLEVMRKSKNQPTP